MCACIYIYILWCIYIIYIYIHREREIHIEREREKSYIILCSFGANEEIDQNSAPPTSPAARKRYDTPSEAQCAYVGAVEGRTNPGRKKKSAKTGEKPA